MGMIDIQPAAMKEEFQKAGLIADIQKSDQGEEKLVLPLTYDAKGRARALLLSVYRPPFSKEQKETKDEQYNLQFLQFFIPIPIPIIDNQMDEMMRLLNMLNTVSELPGFFILENDRVPFFRYNMTCTGNKVDSNLLVMTVGLLLYILEKYSDIIDKIASGSKRLSELES